MRCGECGGEFRSVRGELQWEDRYTGKLAVSNVVYEQCNGCHELLLPPGAVDAIEAARAKKLEEWLANRPLKDFWDSKQVTEFLGITRQALSKGVQVNRLIYRTYRLGKYCYLADSVRQFKRTGDGRMRLQFEVEEPESRFEVAAASTSPGALKPAAFSGEDSAIEAAKELWILTSPAQTYTQLYRGSGLPYFVHGALSADPSTVESSRRFWQESEEKPHFVQVPQRETIHA